MTSLETGVASHTSKARHCFDFALLNLISLTLDHVAQDHMYSLRPNLLQRYSPKTSANIRGLQFCLRQSRQLVRLMDPLTSDWPCNKNNIRKL